MRPLLAVLLLQAVTASAAVNCSDQRARQAFLLQRIPAHGLADATLARDVYLAEKEKPGSPAHGAAETLRKYLDANYTETPEIYRAQAVKAGEDVSALYEAQKKYGEVAVSREEYLREVSADAEVLQTEKEILGQRYVRRLNRLLAAVPEQDRAKRVDVFQHVDKLLCERLSAPRI